ncbi:MAG TPA: protein kinase [Dictyobacter sp.]|jgi:serine/threonine protein kinase|nr:protein kinase [Dictyobacter sp.]
MKGLEGSKLGRYELRFRVARGGMSEVYLGYDRRVRRYVAVKVLYGSDEPFVRRFEREALAIGTLTHDHILPLYDFGEQRPWYYLIMPFVEGGTLRDYIAKREQLTLEEAGSFLEQIASALQHAHDHGVLHRDVKPSNILLRLDGHAYLADFGLAKAKLEAEYRTHSGAMVGTPEYMAPEQSNGQNDHRSDIYSLGIILFQMLTGRVPFTADSPVGVTLKHLQTPPPLPTQFNSDIPAPIEEIILKALSKAPEDRYQEANTFALAYKKALFYERKRDLEEDLLAITTTEKNETATSDQKAEATIAAIEKITTKLDLPSTKPQLFPLEGETPIISYASHINPPHKCIGTRQIVLLMGLLLALVTLSLGLFWHNSNSRRTVPIVAQHHHITTHNRPLWATATESERIKIQSTLAAQARVRATSGVSTALGSGPILYYDNMEQKGGGWIDDGFQCYFSSQGYHVTTNAAHAVAWCYTNQQAFTTGAITVQAQLLHGDFYGLIFHLNPSSKTFYVFEINSTGQYRLQRANGNDPDYWLTLIDWTYANIIDSGYNHTQTVLVVLTNNYFRFYINRQLVASMINDSLYKTGLIGLLVGGDTMNGTQALFKQVAVFKK